MMLKTTRRVVNHGKFQEGWNHVLVLIRNITGEGREPEERHLR